MAQRNINFAPYEFYHVYNRGTDKRVLFQSDKDYRRFQLLLYLANTDKSINLRTIANHSQEELYQQNRGQQQVSIGTYCVMPNHFHIVLTPVAYDGVTNFMRKLCTSYSMYFNKKYDRTGTLFEGRFKSQWVDNDEYMRYLYAYVHLNPAKLFTPAVNQEDEKAGKEAFLCHYQYSSLPDYLGQSRAEGKIISPAAFPEYFQTAAEHWTNLEEWLCYRAEMEL